VGGHLDGTEKALFANRITRVYSLKRFPLLCVNVGTLCYLAHYTSGTSSIYAIVQVHNIAGREVVSKAVSKAWGTIKCVTNAWKTSRVYKRYFETFENHASPHVYGHTKRNVASQTPTRRRERAPSLAFPRGSGQRDYFIETQPTLPRFCLPL
jgi:hypothetical protein